MLYIIPRKISVFSEHALTDSVNKTISEILNYQNSTPLIIYKLERSFDFTTSNEETVRIFKTTIFEENGVIKRKDQEEAALHMFEKKRVAKDILKMHLALNIVELVENIEDIEKLYHDYQTVCLDAKEALSVPIEIKSIFKHFKRSVVNNTTHTQFYSAVNLYLLPENHVTYSSALIGVEVNKALIIARVLRVERLHISCGVNSISEIDTFASRMCRLAESLRNSSSEIIDALYNEGSKLFKYFGVNTFIFSTTSYSWNHQVSAQITKFFANNEMVLRYAKNPNSGSRIVTGIVINKN